VSGGATTIATRAPAGARADPLLPVDLGVGLAQVERRQLPRLHEVLAQRTRVGELHERLGRRIGVRGAAVLRPPVALERVAVPDRAVADEEAVLARGLEVGREVVGGADSVVAHPLHTAGDVAVERVEDLAAPRVDDRDDEPVRVAHGEREEVEARHADHRQPQRLRHRLRGGDADAQPGEEARTDVDGDRAELVQVDAGVAADEVDRRRERLGVAASLRRVERPEHALVPADRRAHLLRRGLDAEDQHSSYT
jgi:hypothetical protein